MIKNALVGFHQGVLRPYTGKMNARREKANIELEKEFSHGQESSYLCTHIIRTTRRRS